MACGGLAFGKVWAGGRHAAAQTELFTLDGHMRKAIRQTKGIVAHLISAYRGILRNAYLIGLIMTIGGGRLSEN